MGFIIELPGAFVRGSTEEEALSKIETEANSYSKWHGTTLQTPIESIVMQRHNCSLQVEDGDCEILLDADRGVIGGSEFSRLVNLASYSGETFLRLWESAELKDWPDPARERPTFYGTTPRTIREIFNHVNRTQQYYLSRASLAAPAVDLIDFLAERKHCIKQLREEFNRNGNSAIFKVDSEEWTLKKILRRFIWHDRIHGKSIVRILQKQRDLGLIGEYEDPFFFELL